MINPSYSSILAFPFLGLEAGLSQMGVGFDM